MRRYASDTGPDWRAVGHDPGCGMWRIESRYIIMRHVGNHENHPYWSGIYRLRIRVGRARRGGALGVS